MGLFTGFLRSKVAMAAIGVLLIAGVSGTLAAIGPSLAGTVAKGGAAASADLGGTGGATAGATGTPNQTGTRTTPNQTGTPTPMSQQPDPATPTPRRTPPTPVPAGQPFHVTGTITVDTAEGTFTLAGHDIEVNGSTVYSGTARSFSQLRTGMTAEVQGTVLADGTYLATEVNAQ